MFLIIILPAALPLLQSLLGGRPGGEHCSIPEDGTVQASQELPYVVQLFQALQVQQLLLLMPMLWGTVQWCWTCHYRATMEC